MRHPLIRTPRMSGAPVIFQYVVPFLDIRSYRRRRGGAKVEIGSNDFQGADLPRRLLHGLGCASVQYVRSRWEQRLDHLQAPAETKIPTQAKQNRLGCGTVDQIRVTANRRWGLRWLTVERRTRSSSGFASRRRIPVSTGAPAMTHSAVAVRASGYRSPGSGSASAAAEL